MNEFPISWHKDAKVLTVPSKRSLGSVCACIRNEHPDWVVVRRSVCAATRFDPYYYAFRPEELFEVDREFPEWRSRPIEEALDLHEHGQSTATAGVAPRETSRMGDSGPASWRVVHLDLDAEPLSVGSLQPTARNEPREAGPPPSAAISDDDADELLDLGPSRGRTRSRGPSRGTRGPSEDTRGPSRDTRGPSAEPDMQTRSGEVRSGRDVPRMRDRTGPEPQGEPTGADMQAVTISADAERRIRAGTSSYVVYQIERAGEAAPFHERFSTEVSTSESIQVLLSTDAEGLEVAGERIQTVDPPAAGRPSRGSFELKALDLPVTQAPNIVRFALMFRQGATELGQIAFSVLIVAAEAEPEGERAHARVEAAPRNRKDDEMLVLLIEQERHGDGMCYEYRLHGEALNLNYLTLRSAPLLDRGGGAAATTLAYVDAIYERVTQDVLSRSDANRLQRQLRALGATMCGELFDPDVSRQLWGLRDRIKTVQVVSWEPYIPWELLRLKDPDSDEIDDRYLSEYGLIRSMPGAASPRELRLNDWRFLAARYPNGLEAPLGGEVSYFTETLPARGIQPVEVSPLYDDFFDAIEAGDFDVLHIACHGEATHAHIENSVLIIGDEPGPGGEPVPLEVDAVTVRQDARLKTRKPLIFLNACESGRHGPSLTAWGGWPTAFLEAGAGAFVGTSWPVREKPARVFAQAFYDALLDGETLSTAATTARMATKDLGDASWLAFKVYGHPRARLA